MRRFLVVLLGVLVLAATEAAAASAKVVIAGEKENGEIGPLPKGTAVTANVEIDLDTSVAGTFCQIPAQATITRNDQATALMTMSFPSQTCPSNYFLTGHITSILFRPRPAETTVDETVKTQSGGLTGYMPGPCVYHYSAFPTMLAETEVRSSLTGTLKRSLSAPGCEASKTGSLTVSLFEPNTPVPLRFEQQP
jgi:hypothetical protein